MHTSFKLYNLTKTDKIRMTGGRGGQPTLFAMDRVQCCIKIKKISLYGINKTEYESSWNPPPPS